VSTYQGTAATRCGIRIRTQRGRRLRQVSTRHRMSPNVTERGYEPSVAVLRRRDMASAGGAIPVNRRSRCHEQASTCLKPAGVVVAVLIWLVTIRYSRGLGESSFGPLRPSPANPGRRKPHPGASPRTWARVIGWLRRTQTPPDHLEGTPPSLLRGRMVARHNRTGAVQPGEGAHSATDTGAQRSRPRGQPQHEDHTTRNGLVERPLPGNGHGGCGRRLGETHRRKTPAGRPGST
jgi:hypothetical protein